MTIEDALDHVVACRNLSQAKARALLEMVMNGAVTPAQIGGLLVALRMKGETGSEITGFARAMRSHVVPVQHSRHNVVDTCGTGGDTLKTFNLSTAAAVVASAAGVPIAKHGNRAFTSACGSADVLEALGVDLGSSAERCGRMLDQIGLAFMFAPNHHPAMKHAAGPRRELKLRTFFNLIGPLSNPAGAERQLIGVYAPALVANIASALRQLGCKRGVVAHGMLGLDEISPVGATKMAFVEKGKVTEKVMQAKDFGITQPKVSEITCTGGLDEAVKRFKASITDPECPEARAVLPSAGVAIWLGDKADSIREGVHQAREAIASGAAARKLNELIRRSKS